MYVLNEKKDDKKKFIIKSKKMFIFIPVVNTYSFIVCTWFELKLRITLDFMWDLLNSVG